MVNIKMSFRLYTLPHKKKYMKYIYKHSIVITSIIVILYYIHVMFILYHRMLKYHNNSYQLENLKSLLFHAFIMMESKNISECIMPSIRQLLHSKIRYLKLKITFLQMTGIITNYVEILVSYFRLIKLLKILYGAVTLICDQAGAPTAM